MTNADLGQLLLAKTHAERALLALPSREDWPLLGALQRFATGLVEALGDTLAQHGAADDAGCRCGACTELRRESRGWATIEDDGAVTFDGFASVKPSWPTPGAEGAEFGPARHGLGEC